MNQALPARNRALDGIRGLAILWVFAFHAHALLTGARSDVPAGWGQTLAQNGLLGVQLFFVLSGFLLALPWIQAAEVGKPGPPVGRFFARRARRILPAYWLHLAVLLGVILPVLRGGYAILGTEIGRTNLWLHLPLLQFLHPGSSTSLGLNMALWSLSIEAQFYLLLPLLAPLFVGNRPLVALPAALLLSLLWKTCAPDLLLDWVYRTVSPAGLVFFDPISGRPAPFPPEMMRFFLERQLPGEIAAFAMGMAAANLYARLGQSKAAARLRCLLDQASIAFLAVATAVLAQLPLAEVLTGATWRTIGMPLFLGGCALLVLAAAHRTPLADRILGDTPLMPIGLISYSLFLWHEPLLRLVAAGVLVPNTCSGAACRLVFALGLCLLVAGLSYLLTEHPGRPRSRS